MIVGDRRGRTWCFVAGGRRRVPSNTPANWQPPVHAHTPACLLFSFASLARREPLGAGGYHAHDRTAGRVAETIDRLDRMNAVSEISVVGIVPADRMRDYSHPGYEAYGRGIVQ